MTASEMPKKSGNKVMKLILFGALTLFVLGSIACYFLYLEISPAIYQRQWSGRLQQGMTLWKTDGEAGRQAVEKMFQDAHSQNLPTAAIMGLYRDYARMLYEEDEKEQGDQQIEKAIGLCKTPPTSNTAEADQLTHAYQDRGWDSHKRFLKTFSGPTGERDQELSVETAERAFGPEHEQTIYKIPTLALIYADLGKRDKAKELIEKAVKTADTKASAKECAWFAYAILARIKAVQGDYKGSVEAFKHAYSIASDGSQTSRVWEDFTEGLRQGQPDMNATTSTAKQLLNKERFDELDAMGSKLLASKSDLADGMWKFDLYSAFLAGGRDLNESQYQQRILDLKKWLKKNPHSNVAIAALAQCHIFNAWSAKNNEDLPNETRERLFKERMDSAKAIMNANPDLSKTNPTADIINVRIAIADHDRAKFLALARDGHKRWPTHFALDPWIFYFFEPNWVGEAGEPEKFITQRANEIGGVKGDVEYARLVWNEQDNIENLFQEGSPLHWKRVKAGFKQIFKDYPNDMESRINYILLAYHAKDLDSMSSIFEDYKPTATKNNMIKETVTKQ